MENSLFKFHLEFTLRKIDRYLRIVKHDPVDIFNFLSLLIYQHILKNNTIKRLLYQE